MWPRAVAVGSCPDESNLFPFPSFEIPLVAVQSTDCHRMHIADSTNSIEWLGYAHFNSVE
jgi:hypothetical protein